MSHKIFIDTAAWIALLNISDGLHQSAKQVMNQLQQQQAFLVTTDKALNISAFLKLTQLP